MRPAERARRYRLLARAFAGEPDRQLLTDLRAWPQLAEALPPPQEEEAFLHRARKEYRNVFLVNVHPLQSIFLGPRSMPETEETARVARVYREAGFRPELVPVDHVTVELGFLAFLLQAVGEPASGDPGPGPDAGRGAPEAERGAPQTEEQASEDRIRAFLHEHLLRWAPVMCLAAERMARVDLYRRLAQVTRLELLEHFEALFANG